MKLNSTFGQRTERDEGNKKKEMMQELWPGDLTCRGKKRNKCDSLLSNGKQFVFGRGEMDAGQQHSSYSHPCAACSACCPARVPAPPGSAHTTFASSPLLFVFLPRGSEFLQQLLRERCDVVLWDAQCSPGGKMSLYLLSSSKERFAMNVCGRELECLK